MDIIQKILDLPFWMISGPIIIVGSLGGYIYYSIKYPRKNKRK